MKQLLLDVLGKYPLPKRYIIGFSGGLDSIVLLHLLSSVLPDLKPVSLVALHVDHGLSGDSGCWSEHCRLQAGKLEIPFHAVKIGLLPGAGNIEANARQLRYRAFRDFMSHGDILLTAHHLDDQAETLLLNLMRGSGVDGLAAMPESRSFHEFRHIRPLLSLQRQELHDYARNHGLEWIDDPSNQDDHFDRNFIRNRIFPLLRTRWPAAATAVARSAGHCQEARDIVFGQAISDLACCQTGADHIISIDQLQKYNRLRQKQIVRAWCRQLAIPLPDRTILNNIVEAFIFVRSDAQPCLSWGGFELHQYHRHLHLLPVIASAAPEAFYNKQTQIFEFSHVTGRLLLKQAKTGLAPAVLERLEIRFREGGEHCYLAGRSGKRRLKKLLQEWHIPAWIRPFLPLLYVDDHLVAIADLGICEGFLASPGYQISWEPDKRFLWHSENHGQ